MEANRQYKQLHICKKNYTINKIEIEEKKILKFEYY